MRRLPLIAAALAALTGAAAAQTTSNDPTGRYRTTINAQLVQLLQDGYEIKAAFAEAGVPYVLLQKTTSAYLCRGGGTAACEKLN